MRGGFCYLNVFPDKELLFALFSQLSRDGTPISYQTYRGFIATLFGTSEGDISLIREDLIDPVGHSKYKQGLVRNRQIGAANKAVVNSCWAEVERIFRRYDVTGTGLGKGELEQVISEIFKDSNGHQKNILVWSALNYVDSTTIKLSDFVPFN